MVRKQPWWVWFVVACFVGFSWAQPVGAESAKDNAWIVEYQGSTYDPGSNTTKFTYWVYDDDKTPAKDHHDLSHWQLSLCGKAVMDAFNSASHNGNGWVDPHSDLPYIKWDTGLNKEVHRGRDNKAIFSFTLKGYWGEGNENVAETKAGTKWNYDGITGPACAPSDPPKSRPTLTLIKHVDGGTAQPSDFPLFIQRGNDAPIGVTSSQKVTLEPGNYKVYEQTLPGYEPGAWGGKCRPDGDFGYVDLESGDDLVCTITNTFTPARLTVIKEVVGGQAEPKDFTMIVADGGGKTIDTFPGADSEGTTVDLPGSGSFTLSETGGPTEYTPTFAGDCSGDYKPGDKLTCTVTNTFSEQPPQLAKLKLTSMCSENPEEQRRWRVSNPNSQPITFTFDVYGTGQVGTLTVDANSDRYFWTDTEPGANTVRIFVNEKLNDTKASSGAWCAKATLTLVKIVEGGGSLEPEDFELLIGETAVASGVPKNLPPGTYTISEITKDHYEPSGWSCKPKEVVGLNFNNVSTSHDVELADGDEVICVITNTFVPEESTLTIRKTTNRSTGDTFGFSVFQGDSDAALHTATLGRNGTKMWSVEADQFYTITESVASGWTLASVACTINGDPITELDRQGQSVTVLVPDLDSHVSCTFHNTKPDDDTPPPPPPPSDDNVIEDTEIIPDPPASEPEAEDEITPEAPASGPDLPFTGGAYLWYLLGGAALTVAGGSAALRRRR